MNSQIFPQHNEFIQEQQRIAIWDMQSSGEPGSCPEKQKRKLFHREEDAGRAAVSRTFPVGLRME